MDEDRRRDSPVAIVIAILVLVILALLGAWTFLQPVHPRPRAIDLSD
jgi:heme A synthase